MRQVDIKGFENYQITEDGRVWSKSNRKWLKPAINKSGYYYVRLYNGGVSRWKRLHRLVAEAFIPNPENKPQVDHIIPISDGGTNDVSNLRWSTPKENANNENSLKNYSERSGENTSMFGKHHSDETKQKLSRYFTGLPNKKLSRKVYQYTLDGALVKIWNSTQECGKNGFSQGIISMCCNGLRKQHKGYRWSYEPL